MIPIPKDLSCFISEALIMTGLHSTKSEDENQKVFVEWSGLTDKEVEIFCRGYQFPTASQEAGVCFSRWR